MTTHIKPTTIVGIKRLAVSIKAAQGVKHAKALDRAAEAAGFENFRHAQNALPQSTADVRRFPFELHLTAYWREPKTWSEGRETLVLPCVHARDDIIPYRKLGLCRTLSRFRAQGPDHLVHKGLCESSERARVMLCSAARELQFMDATRLLPLRRMPAWYPSRDGLPGADHTSWWESHNAGLQLLVDEPYEGAIGRRESARQVWARRYHQLVLLSQWLGMYYPGASQLFMVGREKDEGALAMLKACLDKQASPVTEDQWNGISAAYRPIYQSPGELRQQRKPRAPSDPLLSRDGESSVIYSRSRYGVRRRPNRKMPIAMHEEIGHHIKFMVSWLGDRPSACNRLDAVRCELDDWLQSEYKRFELDDDRFFSVYYRQGEDPLCQTKPTKGLLLSHLARVDELLASHYPECLPLRQLRRQLAIAKRSLDSWVAPHLATSFV